MQKIQRVVRIMVGIPGKTWESDCGLSLINLTSYFAANRIPGYDVQALDFCSVKGSMLPQLRTNIVKKALAVKATHVLFIDSDQTFPANTLHRLLAWKLPVVACNIPTKTFPACPTARVKGPTERGTPLYTYPHDTGKERVWRIGTGVMLIDMSVFRLLPPPWFDMYWKEDQGEDYLVGEDWYFCERVEAAGYFIYIDHGLSNEIRHIGEVSFGHEMCIGELIAQEAYDAARQGSEVQSEDGKIGEKNPVSV